MSLYSVSDRGACPKSRDRQMVLLAPYSQWFRSHRPERAPVQLAKSHVLKRISGASRRYGSLRYTY